MKRKILDQPGGPAVKKSPRTPVPKKFANQKNRALALLATYVMYRCNVKAVDISKLFKALADPLVPDPTHSRLAKFFAGQLDLTHPEFRALAAFLSEKMKKAADTTIADLGLLWPAVTELDAEGTLFPSAHGVAQLDRAFFGALRLEVHDQRPSLREVLGGFWFVIRLSSDETNRGALQFNASLLTVKPTRYIRISAGTPHVVETLVAHFSLRSRASAGGGNSSRRMQIYRGRIVETGNAINFIGNRHGTPKLAMMTWWSPRVQDHGRHGVEAYGIITTSNTYDLTIAGPVGACFVPDTPTLNDWRKTVGLDPNEQTSAHYKKRRRELEELVGVHSENVLIEKLSSVCDDATVKSVVAELNAARERVRTEELGGYFVVRDA